MMGEKNMDRLRGRPPLHEGPQRTTLVRIPEEEMRWLERYAAAHTLGTATAARMILVEAIRERRRDAAQPVAAKA